MNKRLRRLLCITCLLTHAAVAAAADPLPCLGYDPERGVWSKQVIEVRTPEETFDYFVCPPASAILSVFKQPMKAAEGRLIGIDANCCPLPAKDILVDEHIEVEENCPEQYVATGAQLPRYTPHRPKLLRCTKINSKRYQLGASVEGQFWGAGGSGAFPMQEPQRIKASDIPLGLRHGATRYDARTNAFAGCIGKPIGSLLVGKRSKRCNGHLFRELQYRGLPGDPPEGSPVQIIPQCTRIADIFDPFTKKCEYDEGLEGFRRQ